MCRFGHSGATLRSVTALFYLFIFFLNLYLKNLILTLFFFYFLMGLLFQKPDVLTTGAGHPVGDKLNLQTAGPRGPLLVQDVVFTDEMAHFDRERIPERVVHAKGAGQCWTG